MSQRGTFKCVFYILTSVKKLQTKLDTKNINTSSLIVLLDNAKKTLFRKSTRIKLDFQSVPTLHQAIIHFNSHNNISSILQLAFDTS
jgi:hypothetical protein